MPWPVVVVAAVVLVASLAQTELWPTPVAAEPLPTGTFSKGGPIGNCPAGHDCTSFTVSGCTNVSKPQDGVMAHAKAIGPSRGMVVIFSGGGGTIFWSTDNVPADTMIEDVRRAGLDVVQVRWTRAWTLAEPGEIEAGAAHVACRPATAVKWIHDNLYAGLDVPTHGVGECGFCVTGTSGGSSQAAYTASHFGMEHIVDAVIPVSGPTHAAMAKGCLRRAGEQDYWYSGASTRNIDYTYGFTGTERPCEQNSTDPLWTQRWDRESVDTQGSDYNHPQTRVHLIIGGDDRAMQAHGGDYFNRLQAAGSPLIRMEVVPGMPHAVTQSTAGMEALTAALIGDNPPPPSTPALSITDVNVTEGNSGATTATFTVTLSAASTTTATGNWATADGTGTVADNDYLATTGSLSFAPGEVSKTISVTVNGDTKVEPDETFTVNLSSPANATIGDGQGVGTIVDDDTVAPVSAVTNGGFESGLTGWSAMSASVVSSPTRTGSGAARLGGTVSASTGLVQEITVPAGGQLELWVRTVGADTTTADTLRVQVGTGRYYETKFTLTSAGTHGTWTQVKVDLSAYAGQTTNLRLLSFNDATNPTTFYVDDVSLVASSGEEPPPTT
ncbi:MAG TPA: Calx-beta domain-containing protein, partial [Acidimicrobiales bacterium]|nr:Calx-beta domain-containing protein [Acidimicrobiales bacterium]